MYMLCRKVAELYHIDPYVHGGYNSRSEEYDEVWLHENYGKCFELAINNKIEMRCTDLTARASIEIDYVLTHFDENVNEYDSKEDAMCIAILKCLIYIKDVKQYSPSYQCVNPKKSIDILKDSIYKSHDDFKRENSSDEFK